MTPPPPSQPPAMSGDNPALRPGRYRHFKGGEYQVIGVARHSETGEPLVVYTPLYDSSGLWVRPLSMFLETVERDGEHIARFSFIDEGD